MAIALVANNAFSGASATSVTLSGVTFGSGRCVVLVCHIKAGSTSNVTAVTDSGGNTWTIGPSGFQSGSNSRCAIAYCLNTTAALSSGTITVTLSAAVTSTYSLSEWTGVDSSAIDTSATLGQAATTTPAACNVTTTNANDLIIGGISYGSATAPTLNTGSGGSSGFTALTEVAGSTFYGGSAYRIVSATGTYGPTWTTPSVGTGEATLALKAASGSTQYALTGTAAATAGSTAGNPTSVLQITGADAATASNTSGNPTSILQMTGSDAAVSGLASTMNSVLAITGTDAAVSALTGDPIKTPYLLTGTAAATAAATAGAITSILQIAGTDPAVSAAVSSMTSTLKITGTDAAQGGGSGSITSTLLISGTDPASSTAVGTPIGVYPTTGTAAAVSGVSGVITGTLQITGQAASQGGGAGTLNAQFVIAGTDNAVSSLTGNITVPGQGPQTFQVAGTATAVSAAIAAITSRLLITGTAVSTSALIGTPTAIYPVTATVTATSSGGGTITAVLAVNGVCAATSGVSGAWTSRLGITGTAAATSTTAGAWTARFNVAGSAGAVSGLTGVVVLTPQGLGRFRVVKIALAGRDPSIEPVSRTVFAVPPSATFEPVVRVVKVAEVPSTMTVVPEVEPMKMPVTGRRYYRLTITTTPTITSWSASFDGGTTWVAGNAEGNNVFSWLLDTPSTIGGHNAGAVLVNVTKGGYTEPILRSDQGSEELIYPVPDFCNIEWT